MRCTIACLWTLLLCSRASAEWPDFAVSDPVLMDLNGSKDVALIVGIQQYESLSRIPGARANAEVWSQFFITSLKIPSRNVVRLNDREAKEGKIRSTLDELVKRVKNGGRFWFVFIGHGAPSKRPGDGLLAGYDAEATPEGLEEHSLHRSELTELLNKDSISAVAILDACFSGLTEQGPLVPDLLPAAIVSNVVPARVLLMTAAGSDEYTGPLVGVSPERPAFSYLMLGALRGWADKNKDGRVTAHEAVTYVDKTLQQMLQGSRTQHPSLDANDKNLVLSDGTEEAPEVEPQPIATQDPEGYGPPMRAAGSGYATRDTGAPASASGIDDEANVHAVGSLAVGAGGGAAYNGVALFGEAALGARFGNYVRLTGVVLGSGSGFKDTNTTSSNPSPRATFGVTGAAALGVELARSQLLSMSADVLGGVTYLGERCDNPIADGAGNLICDRVQPSGIGPAGGVRLAMQVRVGQPSAASQGVLLSGTALTSKTTGLFGGVFLGYGAW